MASPLALHISHRSIRASVTVLLRPIRPLHTIHPITSKEPKTEPTKSSPPPKIKPHQLPPRPKIPEEDLRESFIHGSGPGGQKINKTASAVQLTHLPTGTVLKCQATRSRIQNRTIARRLLAEKLEEAEKGDLSRTRLKGALKEGKKASMKKKARRKYRALAEGEEEERPMDEEGEAYDGKGEVQSTDGDAQAEVANDLKSGDDTAARLFQEAIQKLNKSQGGSDAVK